MEGKAESKPGIDYEKLKSLGVPDEVIATLDPRDGGNITPQGEVLFLDEERLKRRELPNKPLHKNHPRGLGIKDFLMTKVLATTPATWERTLKVFMLIVKGAKLTGREDLASEIYKRITQFSPDEKMYSHGNVLPLNVDMTDEGKSTVLPIDLIMDLIDRYQKIDAAIVASNASTFVTTSYGTYSVAGAIALRNRLRGKGTYSGEADFEKTLADKMSGEYQKQRAAGQCGRNASEHSRKRRKKQRRKVDGRCGSVHQREYQRTGRSAGCSKKTGCSGRKAEQTAQRAGYPDQSIQCNEHDRDRLRAFSDRVCITKTRNLASR